MLTGQMQNHPLLISSLIEHARRYHGDSKVISRLPEGGTLVTDLSEIHRRACMGANLLHRFGISQSDRVGTLAWNSSRHFELYFAVSGMGAVLNTINPRLFEDQIAYIINHANDKVIFFDPNVAELCIRLAPRCPSVRTWICLAPPDAMPASIFTASVDAGAFLSYEAELASEHDQFAWPLLDEETAASLCYTSGTTGNPKGVLYSHRSTVLHALSIVAPDAFAISAKDSILPVVPMFHVNAWGFPYAVAMTGADFVLPGQKLDGDNLFALMDEFNVSKTAGVPTVWQSLLDTMRKRGRKPSSLENVIIGGSAAPIALVDALETEFNISVNTAWGMTELSPVGTVNKLKPKHQDWDSSQLRSLKVRQGRPIFGIELSIVDGNGQPISWDGKTPGNLLARGPWVCDRYYGSDQAASVNGWFPTGDIATMDHDGFMEITDRSKDVIKSGGEWISSIALENIAMSHPAIAEAAVIGANHNSWGERPLLIVVPRRLKVPPSREEILSFFKGRVASWCIPDDVIFVKELPHTGTGKLQKSVLRELYSHHLLSTQDSSRNNS